MIKKRKKSAKNIKKRKKKAEKHVINLMFKYKNKKQYDEALEQNVKSSCAIEDD